MKFFQIQRIEMRRYKIKKFYICGIPLFQYIKLKKHNKTKKIYSFIKKVKPVEGQRIFYLKVHRVHKTAIDCIAHWLEVAHELDGYVYFVCDNPEMEDLIQNQIVFYNQNFEFIKSDKHYLKKYISKILDNVPDKKKWQRIAHAMTTAFVHATKNNYPISYNIDADDIIVYSNAKKIAKAFKKAEEDARNKDFDLLNLDMFVSKTFGVHWSFGVVLCTNPKKCVNAIKRNTNWRNNVSKNTVYTKIFNFNIDWLFTYFRDNNILNMNTFYIENALVVHMPDLILEHGWAFMFQWHNGYIKFPILAYYDDSFCTNSMRKIPIYKNLIKIEADITENEYRNEFARTYRKSLLGQIKFQKQMLGYALVEGIIEKDSYNKYSEL